MTDQPIDLSAVTDAFRDSVDRAQVASVVTTTTYTLPGMVIYPDPDGPQCTRSLAITVTERNRGAHVEVAALAAPVQLNPAGETEELAVQIIGDTDWKPLPAEVAPLFMPVIDPDQA